MLRAATAPLDGVDEFVFKGGTSLSKAYGIIERFSEDIDLLVITTATGKALKRVLRAVADRTSTDLGIEHERAHEGRGFLNARYTYPARREVEFLSPGVLLEMGSPGGPLPNQRRSVQSLMADGPPTRTRLGPTFQSVGRPGLRRCQEEPVSGGRRRRGSCCRRRGSPQSSRSS